MVSHTIGDEPLRDNNLVKVLQEQCKNFKTWRSATDLEYCYAKKICVLMFFIQLEFSHVFKNSLKLALNGHIFFCPEAHLLKQFFCHIIYRLFLVFY